MSPNSVIVIALGANLPSPSGAPEDTLSAALEVLSRSGVTIRARSRFFQSPAWPDPTDPPFVNATALVSSRLSPFELLNLLHAVETSFHRRRSTRPEGKNAPRTLDLDLIDYQGLVQAGPPELPHPRAAERGFVLIPMRDIVPEWRHPDSRRTLDELIADLGPEGGMVRPVDALAR